MARPSELPQPADLVPLVRRLARAGQSDQAGAILERITQTAPNAEVRVAVGRAWLALDRGDLAKAVLTTALPHPEAHCELGYIAQSGGDFSAAASHFEASFQLQPDQGSAYHGWAQSHRLTDQTSPVLTAMLRAREATMSDRERMLLQYALGKAFADLSQPEQAVKAYDEANAIAKQTQRPPFDRRAFERTVDAIIALFTQEFIAKAKKAGSPRKLPLLVTGMMRSGTTLTEQILTTDPTVGSAGEVEFFVETGPEAIDFAQRRILPGRLEAIGNEYTRILRTLANTAADKAIERVVDKSPMNLPFLGLIHAAFPKARIVALRRDGLDTCWSIYTNAYGDSPAFAHDQVDIAFAWRQNERLLDHWKQVLPPDAYLEVTYECLVTEPESSIKAIVAHCGLRWSEAFLHPENNRGRITTSSVFQARQAINPNSVHRSRAYLPWLTEFKELVP